jgi:DNA-binding SARP family transcriptional activator
MARPVLVFMTLRLLIAALEEPGGRMSRESLADETFPGLDRVTQLNRLRNRLHALRELPEAFRSRISSEGAVIQFDVAGCHTDVAEIEGLAAQANARIFEDPVMRANIERVLEVTSGEFLPLWEELDDKVTGRRGASLEHVLVLRERLTRQRVDLSLMLSDHYLGQGYRDKAIAILESAHHVQAGRSDVAQRLKEAYRATGRQSDAERLLEEGT